MRISEEEWFDILETLYWDPWKADDIPPIGFTPFDRSPESGVILVLAHDEHVEIDFLDDFVHIRVDLHPIHISQSGNHLDSPSQRNDDFRFRLVFQNIIVILDGDHQLPARTRQRLGPSEQLEVAVVQHVKHTNQENSFGFRATMLADSAERSGHSAKLANCAVSESPRDIFRETARNAFVDGREIDAGPRGFGQRLRIVPSRGIDSYTALFKLGNRIRNGLQNESGNGDEADTALPAKRGVPRKHGMNRIVPPGAVRHPENGILEGRLQNGVCIGGGIGFEKKSVRMNRFIQNERQSLQLIRTVKFPSRMEIDHDPKFGNPFDPSQKLRQCHGSASSLCRHDSPLFRIHFRNPRMLLSKDEYIVFRDGHIDFDGVELMTKRRVERFCAVGAFPAAPNAAAVGVQFHGSLRLFPWRLFIAKPFSPIGNGRRGKCRRRSYAKA